MAVEFVLEPGLSTTWEERRIEALVRSLVEPELNRSDYSITVHLVSLARLLVGPVARVAAVTETVHRVRPRVPVLAQGWQCQL